MRIYFDHNASAPLASGVVDAMVAAAGASWGNPSSVHAEGRAARDLVEVARRSLAASLGAAADDLVFTSGGTEADILGVRGLLAASLLADGSPRVATSQLEHPAVLGAVSGGAEPIIMKPDPAGRIASSTLAKALEQSPGVVTLQLANHELGTLQDVSGLAALAHEHGARVHCDAVQAWGRRPIDVGALGVDSLAISGHKIGGPKGVGALWISPAADWQPPARGAGHQERGRRPGTEALMAVAGFGQAARGLRQRLASAARVAGLAAALERGLLDLGASVHGANAPRIGNTVNAGFASAPAEIVATALDLAGVSVSTGAACTSGSIAPSPVLLALGLSSARAAEALRFSLGPENTLEEVQTVLELLPPIVARTRQFSGA